MNALTGIWRLDGRPITNEELHEVLFQSPLWTPDHQMIWNEGAVGFASTQRYITPECAHAPMPYQDPASKCVIVGDIYLSDRDQVIDQLHCEKDLSDAELILKAYLKWGEDCPQYLFGSFMFAIWDPSKQKLFLTTDQFGSRPCLYAYKKNAYFVFSNTMNGFRKFCPSLTLNRSVFMHFTVDTVSEEETCYLEVEKIRAAHSLTITKIGLKKRNYWRIKRENLRLKKREDYYEAFRSLFEATVKKHLRTPYPVSAHISGGLDSSAIAAMTAFLLQKQNLSLYGFTAIPNHLDGPSYRPGWYYHELPRVETLLKQYPNIEHFVYRSISSEDTFEKLRSFYPYIDQPFRNVSNLDWVLESLELCLRRGSRTLLVGQSGNGSISWKGQTLRDYVSEIYSSAKMWMAPRRYLSRRFVNHNPAFFRTSAAQEVHRKAVTTINIRRWMLTEGINGARQATIRPFSFWFGANYLDPLKNVKLVEFCYNVPQWVYCRGRHKLEKRLLAREALKDILPEAIRLNPYRGEQSADWYEQFNFHHLKWRSQLERLPNDSWIWDFYDRKKIMGLFNPVSKPSKEATSQVLNSLFRCMSLGSYLNCLENTNSENDGLRQQNHW